MAEVIALACIRCGTRYSPDHFAEDCTECRPIARSNLTVVYSETFRGPREKPIAAARWDLWRYGDVLPVSAEEAVSLGEGGSPLHRLSNVGAALGMANLFAKDETRNPTWSFKDRLACLAVSSAKAKGARVIVSSSSGNAAAAAAAYAAKAGLRCVIFTFRGAAGPMVTQMRAYGADVVAVQNKADRWTLMERAVRRYGWFPTSPFFGPVVGSNPYGIEGYKTLAYEIAEQMEWRVPDWCVLPVCYGDALYGMWKGFEDMVAFGWTDRVPRMVAAEIYGSLSQALETGAEAPSEMDRSHETVAVSIGATRSTVQALTILRRSGGHAVTVSNEEMTHWQAELARREGLYVEATSAATLAAVERLLQDGRVNPSERVAVLLTASGLKDPGPTESALDPLLTLPSDVEEAERILKNEGLFSD
jgi:threonine synthase